VWLGFWAVEVDPSPKSHCQEVGLPVDVSVNCTDCPAAGEAGLQVNDASRVVSSGSGPRVTEHLPIMKTKLMNRIPFESAFISSSSAAVPAG
jgi:hypothetical protein